MIERLTCFTGSTTGNDPKWVDLARAVGADLADRGIGVVYGAGGGGLMGALARGALDAGGEVIGVIPSFMIEREWGRDDLTEVHVVQTMHERKALMADLTSAFLALPGGMGTLEEVFEVWTRRQIGLLDKPVGFLDADGFWTPLLDSLRGISQAGFMSQASPDDIVVAPDPDSALAGLESRGVGTRMLRPLT
ncbi:TIGR00730 family Rossman fold protein [Janibacter limosus]|uniref:TIGR00730 family Rossman fold protein n=1 Tax=Janibacter limosus TaxID=53458 RepID=A0AC61U3L1_9MICO|nr:TIGR00730 family Rossman fold protein [Janibacter limosus]UUZ44591.1 TIGR00730 family Rossman fold protein [Janibacter limosus]